MSDTKDNKLDQDKKKILEDFFDQGYSTRVEDLIPKSGDRTLKIKFRNIGMAEQMDLERLLKDLKDEPSRYAIQRYSIALLARTLIRWGEVRLDDVTEWEQFLSKQSVVLVDKALKIQQKFDKKVKESLEVGNVLENFSPTGEQLDVSKPSPEELSQENVEASEKQ